MRASHGGDAQRWVVHPGTDAGIDRIDPGSTAGAPGKGDKNDAGDAEGWVRPPGPGGGIDPIQPGSAGGPPGKGDKDDAMDAVRELRKPLRDLQERLYAENKQSLLIVLQALDAGGKDGTVKHVFK